MGHNDDMTNTFTAIEPNGDFITCDVLLTFDSEDTGKSYIVFTDGSTDEHGFTCAYAAIYDPAKLEACGSAHAVSGLQPIETEMEWQLVEGVFDSLQTSLAEAGSIPPGLFD